MHCEHITNNEQLFLLTNINKDNKLCNKCIVHCSIMLVNTLTNVQKRHLIVKCYHYLFIILNLTVFSLLLFHRSFKEDSECQSLVSCVYKYPYVRWVKKKNSNKVKNNLTDLFFPRKVSIDITIVNYFGHNNRDMKNVIL